MDYMGVLIRFLYMAGDLILYRYVLGYEFQKKRWMLVIGALCAVGYVTIPIETFYYLVGYWGHYLLLFAAGKFSFHQIKGGLVLFVIAARRVLGSLMDGIFSLLLLYAGDDVDTWNLYAIGLNACFAVCMGLLSLWKRRRGLEFHLEQIRPAFFWVCGIMLMVPTISSYFWVWVTNEERLRVRGVVEDGLLGLAIIGLAIAILILNLRGNQLKREQKLNLQCIKEQTEQYKVVNEKQQELRAFRHDINGHILAMRSLAGAGNLEGLRNYLDKWAMLKEEATYISTGHVIGDAILNHYDSESRRNQVAFEVEGSFREPLRMSETDLCIILTNLVGNAYEAAVQCSGERYVRVKIARVGIDQTFITIQNSVKEKPALVKGRMLTTKEDPALHGLGIENAKKAAEKYGGEILFELEEDQVTTNILF